MAHRSSVPAYRDPAKDIPCAATANLQPVGGRDGFPDGNFLKRERRGGGQPVRCYGCVLYFGTWVPLFFHKAGSPDKGISVLSDRGIARGPKDEKRMVDRHKCAVCKRVFKGMGMKEKMDMYLSMGTQLSRATQAAL